MRISQAFSAAFLLMAIMLTTSCSNIQSATNRHVAAHEQLLRLPYTSVINQDEREYFVYLPRGYGDEPNKKWPVMMYLHGNGDRGDGKDELEYVNSHGPIHEAWAFKKDLPFIIIAPQLHMFSMDKRGLDYIDNRTPAGIPKRLTHGIPHRQSSQATAGRMSGDPEIADMSNMDLVLPEGWDYVEQDLLDMIDTVLNQYSADKNRLYLTGISYGGVGTWYMASKHPELFAAIAPIVGWGHPDLMAPIAKHKVPVWAFAGGQDYDVKVDYFYAGLNKLKELGHTTIRFTTHEDMAHDTWRRVYNGYDLYSWMLEHSTEK